MSYRVAVRALCEFAAKCGDLDLRFTPAPTSREGQEGHREVATRRGASYQAEVPLAGEFGLLRLRGRADGYDPERQQLEEIKTYRGRLEAIPANHRILHWAQAKVYGWLLCEQLGLPELRVALVYYDVDTGKESVFDEVCAAAVLREFASALCTTFLRWAESEAAHRQARDVWLDALRFPHADFRPGQRVLAEAVYRCARRAGTLLAQAPTGIGKTVGTLFPLLKACTTERIDKVFYLTAKTPGRGLALEALALLTGPEGRAPLRVLELTARDKSCLHPELACHGDSCPLARGFYDRLPAARQAAVQRGFLTQAALRELAQEHQVCPYYLAQEMARWCDVVVADYNYYFDTSAMLHAMAEANEWRVVVLVDEAHNLLERGRQMYTAELHPATLAAARKYAPKALRRALGRVEKAWRELDNGQHADYECRADVPATVLGTLQGAVAAITDYQLQHPTEVNAELQRFYFDALQFQLLAENFGEHSLFDLSRESLNLLGVGSGSMTKLCIRNVVPAAFLQDRFGAAHCSVLFSATLVPPGFYRDMLGLPADCAWIDVPAPFTAERLTVITERISTRYRDRAASVLPIARLITDQYRRAPGNYLAFFSSFDYLQRVAEQVAGMHPELPIWRQERRMDESAREAFLARFSPEGEGVGFAVLGGAFAEGVDLPGSRLIGAFVATLGLPQLNPVNEEFCRRIEALFGQGYDYTYLFPGLQKVVQAAGRVIRTPQDRGTIYLIDERFLWQKVCKLLPHWWPQSQAASGG